jgi:hypothetical protein
MTRLRRYLLPVVLVVVAANVTAQALTRDGVGPVEYVTLTALVALLLSTAFRLARRTPA